ncbi:MAG TPA: hypothetical protein VH815_02620 [Acidobacteriota bacterium]
MEIRKSNSVVSTVTQESASSESAKSVKNKSNGIASVQDSFEVSSSSNQENSGTKQLGENEQQEASKFNYKDLKNNEASTQNGRPTYEDAKNPGLAARLGHNKEQTEADSKRQLPNGVTVADIKNSPGQGEQSSAAVKDAQQKLNDGGRTNYRESLDQEMTRRRQDATMHGASSAIDRALNSKSDPTAKPKGKSDVPTGKDAHASKVDDAINLLGAASIIGGPYGAVFGAAVIGTHAIDNILDGFLSDLPDHLSDNLEKKADIFTDAIQKQQLQKNQEEHDAKRKAKETIIVDGKVVQTPSAQMPGIDDRGSGNIPEDIKKSIEYDMQQIRNSKPKSGGETELTDGGVTGNSADGSVPINNAFTRAGGVMGAVAQPTRAGEYVGGPSNGTVGSAVQNGGATDSLDGSSWTGTTHQDDPADVQFGPNTPVAGSVDSKKTNEDSDKSDSTSNVLDQILNRQSKKAE